jgi:hypothetical protein
MQEASWQNDEGVDMNHSFETDADTNKEHVLEEVFRFTSVSLPEVLRTYLVASLIECRPSYSSNLQRSD